MEKLSNRNVWARYFVIAALTAVISMAMHIPARAARTNDCSKSYSQYITVASQKMHVVFFGELNEGGTDFADQKKPALVMLPGLGVPSPHIYFKPLAEELAANYNVVIAEPLGYGLSDLAKTSRTVENINAELNEALDKLKIQKCVLAGHSISGIYGLNFVYEYPEKVQGFISIDGTVYDDGLAEALAMEQDYLIHASEEFDSLRNSFDSLQDFQNALTADPDKYGASLPEISGYAFSEADQKEYITAYSRCSNAAIRDEISRMNQALLTVKGKKFPSDLPVLTLISSDNADAIPAWKPAHLNQLDLTTGKHTLYTVKGGHYIWYTNLSDVVKYISSWPKLQAATDLLHSEKGITSAVIPFLSACT